jgi:hypothetical protein
MEEEKEKEKEKERYLAQLKERCQTILKILDTGKQTECEALGIRPQRLVTHLMHLGLKLQDREIITKACDFGKKFDPNASWCYANYSVPTPEVIEEDKKKRQRFELENKSKEISDFLETGGETICRLLDFDPKYFSRFRSKIGRRIHHFPSMRVWTQIRS